LLLSFQGAKWSISRDSRYSVPSSCNLLDRRLWFRGRRQGISTETWRRLLNQNHLGHRRAIKMTLAFSNLILARTLVRRGMEGKAYDSHPIHVRLNSPW
jgi:hypothetical protein